MVIKDIKRISKNSLGFTFGFLLTTAISFFLLPIYTRYLTPADYGIISVAAVLSSLISIISFFGMRSAINRFFYNYQGEGSEFRKFISTIWISVTSFAVFLSILLTIFGIIIFSIIFPDLPFYPYILLVIWTTFFTIPFSISLSLLQMRERSFAFGLLCVLQFITNALLIIFFVVGFHEGALGSLKGQFFSAIIFFVIGMYYLKPDISIQLNIQKFKEAIKFGLPLLPHELAGWITTQLNRIFLSVFTTLSTVGIFSLGYQFGSLLCILTGAINLAWVPYFMSTAQEEGENAKPKFAGLVVYYLCLIFFAGLGIILFAPNVIRILTTPSFYPAIQVVPLIVFAFLFDGMYYICANNLFFAKKTGYLSFSTISGAIVSIVLGFLLIHTFGIYGAAVSLLCSYAWTFGLAFYFSNKFYPIPYEYNKMGKIVLIFTITVFLSIIIPYYGLIVDIALKVIILGIFILGLILSHVLSITELNLGKKYALETIQDLRISRKN